MILGPEPLYQLLWMIGLCVCVEALDSFRGRGDTPGIRSVGGFFLSGIVIGILGYLDVDGTALATRSVFCTFSGDKATGKMDAQNRCRSIGIYSVQRWHFLSASLWMPWAAGSRWEMYFWHGGKSFPREDSHGSTLYEQPAVHTYVPDKVAAVIIVAVMVTILACGAFSYWCRKEHERQSVWIALALALGILNGCGMLSEDMPGLTLLYLLLAVAAGAGVQAILPYEMELLREVKGVLPETVEAVPVGAASTKRRLKVQDLETEEFPEEEPADFQEETCRNGKNTADRKSTAPAEKACA